MTEISSKAPTQKKNPIIAAIASLLIPGLGQIYNKELRKDIGFIIIAVMFISVWLLLTKENRMVGPILAAGGACVLLWIGSMYEAYKTAEKINFQIQMQ